MNAKICPICKNKFFSENKYFKNDSALHNYCELKKNLKRNKEQRLLRSSTPIAENDSSSSSSFSDSVTDFFYQSWKNGLHSGVKKTRTKLPKNWNRQPHTVLQPVYYAPQYFYMYVQYVQQVGYRPDGTYGILPSYWIWKFN